MLSYTVCFCFAFVVWHWISSLIVDSLCETYISLNKYRQMDDKALAISRHCVDGLEFFLAL